MTKNFTPFTYLFIFLYLLLMISLFTFNDFFIYWTIMEFSSLIFMGLAFSVFNSGYSQLMSYFLIQAFASLVIIISYIYYSPIFFTFALTVKLSMFPFSFWFMNLMVRFSNFILWLSMSLHKIPAILMLYNFNIYMDLNMFFLCMILSVFFSGVLMIKTLNLRYLLILASIGNNSWFILCQYVSIMFFLLFVTLYSFLLFVTLYSFSSFSKETTILPNSKYFYSLMILSMSGLPPFPLFYFKLYLIFSVMSLNFDFSLFSVFLFLSSFMLMGYVHYLFTYYVNAYNNLSNLFLFTN